MTESTRCPNGHDSADAEWCSVCGTRIADADRGTDPPASASAATCTNCGAELDEASRFCEVCGYDPATGSLPKAPVAQPAAAASPPEPVAAAGTWTAVVGADRDYYERNAVEEVAFPLGMPTRTIELQGDRVGIGRRSRSRGTHPELDLAGPPEDAAVSHTHASLLRQEDGSWAVVDHGSTNGTYLNASADPIPPNELVRLESGDKIYLGAWTVITLELRP